MGFFGKSGLSGIVGGALGAVVAGPAGAALGYGIGSSLGSYSDERSAAKDAYNRNVALWNMNNAYNTPKEQMDRLREAGLNPRLIYGSGSVTGLASSMAHKAEKQGVGRVGEVGDFEKAQGLLNMIAQRENLGAQNDLLRYQATYADLQAQIEKEKLSILRHTGMLPGTSKAAGPVQKVMDSLFGDNGKTYSKPKKRVIDRTHAAKKKAWQDLFGRLGAY